MNHEETDMPGAAQEDAEALERAQQTVCDATVDTEEARRRLRIQQEDEEDNKYRRRITI